MLASCCEPHRIFVMPHLVKQATSEIVAKLWNLCNVLRDDGVTYHQPVKGSLWADLVGAAPADRLPVSQALLHDCIFYAQGIKTNAPFFTRGKRVTGKTKEVWVYDMRANMLQFGKRTPFTREYFRTAPDAPASTPRDKFEDVFDNDPCGGPGALARRVDTGKGGGWRCFSREQIKARSGNPDIRWLKGDTAETEDAQREEPALVARLVMRELHGAMADLRSLLDELGEGPDAALDDDLLADDATADEAPS